MSAYSDLILAAPSLRHYWLLGNSGADQKGSTPFTFGSAVQKLVLGRVAGDLAVRFDRNTPTLSYGIATPPSLTGAYSIEMIVKSGTPTTNNFLLGAGGSGAGWHWSGGTSMGGYVGVSTGGVRATNSHGTAATFPAGWHHAVFAVGSTGLYEIFIDGASIGTGDAGLGGATAQAITTNPLVIGNYDQGFVASFAFDGWMANLAFYTTKLDLTTVQSHYAALGTVATATDWRVWTPVGLARARAYSPPAASIPALLRAYSVAKQGAYRVGRMSAPPSDFVLPAGMTPYPGTIGGIARPGRMAAAPPAGFISPAPMDHKPVTLGSGAVVRPSTAGQVWPR